MTLKQLKYLLGVVDNGFNITATADRLYTSQPGISKQLRQLEEELGVPLFARKGRALHALTPAGEQVVDYARKINRDVENIREIGREFSVQDAGTISIATTHTQARYVLPTVLRRFHDLYPSVHIELHQGTSEQIADLVGKDKVDFAIATESKEDFPSLNLLPCFSWDRIILVPKEHPLVLDQVPLTLERLCEFSLITYVFGSDHKSSFLDAFQSRGLEPRIAFTARDADVIKTYVRMGVGVGVIAPMALQAEDLRDLSAIDAAGLFARVITWIGVPRDHAFRVSMADFVSLFAPHWPRPLVKEAICAATQDEVDDFAKSVELPTFTLSEQPALVPSEVKLV